MFSKKMPWLIGLVVTLVALGALAVFDRLQQELHYEVVRTKVATELGSVRDRLQVALNLRLESSQGLVAYVSAHPDISDADFETFARSLVASQPPIELVGLVRGTVLSAYYPRRGHERANHLDLLTIPSQRAAVLQCMQERRTVIAGPVKLVEGGQAFIARIPILREANPGDPGSGAYWGILNLLIDPAKLFQEGGLDDPNLEIAILGKDGSGVTGKPVFGSRDIFRFKPVTSDLPLPVGNWELAAVPRDHWAGTAPNTIRLRVGGIAVALLLGLLAGLRANQPNRLRAAVQEATAALRDSEAKFRQLYENSPDFIALASAEGVIRMLNRGAAQLTADQLIGRSIYDYYSAAEADRLRKEVARVLAGAPTVTLDLPANTSDGRTRWFRNRITAIQHPGKEPMAMFISTEITEAVEQDSALRESEERFRRAFNESPLGMIMIGLDYRLLRANESFCRMLGYEASEITGITLAEISPADEFEIDRANIAKSLSGEIAVVRREKRYLVKSGGVVWCNLTGTIMRDKAGQPIYLLGMLEDITGRKATEEALQAAESRNRAILNALPDIIQRVDRHGRFLDFNPGTETTRFVDLKTVLKKTVRDFFPPAVAENFMGVVAKTLDSGELQQFEICLEKDGVGVDYDVRVVVCGPDEVLVLVRNITVQKRSREVLRAIVEATSHEVGEDFLLSLVRILANTLHVRYAFISEFVDPTGQRARTDTFWADDRFLEPFEYDRAGTPSERINREEVIHIASGLQAAFPRAEMIRRFGADSYLAVPLRDADGAVCGLMGIMHDQPFSQEPTALSVLKIFGVRASVELQRKRSEAALKESEERFRRLSEASFEGLVIHEKGVVIDANQVFADMFGYTVDEIIGKSVFDFTTPQGAEAVRRRLLAEDERPYETEGVRRDGSRFVGELLPRMIPFHGRRVRVTAARDVTERKRAEAERHALEMQVQHSQKLESLGLLAGGIAHDFNNLLTGILGHASLAQLELADQAPARNAIQQIENAARRAADLTNQLLAYSGKGRFVVQPLNLTQLVQEMAQLLEISIPKKIQLAYNFYPALPLIDADASQVQQIVMNLITNAADAIGTQTGSITVSTGQETIRADHQAVSYLDKTLLPGSYAYLEVADTGCGMTEETQARIFDPFFTTKFTGRGLGLAAVLGIVRGHGGALRVRSAPDRGTVFRVLLPVASIQEAPRPPKPKTDSFFVGVGTVLIVDDEESVRTVARMMLQKFGFRVLIARDGREGLEVFQRHQSDIQVVLLDMTMPQMSGEEVFHAIRRIHPGVAVVLSSGFSEQEAVSRFGLDGLAGFIQKPYRTMDLIQAIRTALNP
ncbi:MAG: PAS domain S-box protein [Planctomycetota bacterium]